MLPFLTLMNIGFVIFNFTTSTEVLDFPYCVAIFNLLAACFIAYVWGANS